MHPLDPRLSNCNWVAPWYGTEERGPKYCKYVSFWKAPLYTAPPISKGPENWPPELVIFASTILKLHNPLDGSHFCVTLHSLHTWYTPFYAGHVYTHSHYRRSLQCCWNRDRRGGGAVAPFPEFGRSVNPISTRDADYDHHIATRPQIFRPLRWSAF